eukprot:763156-Hanusia_phi.AAC.1
MEEKRRTVWTKTDRRRSMERGGSEGRGGEDLRSHSLGASEGGGDATMADDFSGEGAKEGLPLILGQPELGHALAMAHHLEAGQGAAGSIAGGGDGELRTSEESCKECQGHQTSSWHFSHYLVDILSINMTFTCKNILDIVSCRGCKPGRCITCEMRVIDMSAAVAYTPALLHNSTMMIIYKTQTK